MSTVQLQQKNLLEELKELKGELSYFSSDIKIAFHAFINPIALLLITGNILYPIGYALFTSFLYIKIQTQDTVQKRVILFVNTIYIAIFMLLVVLIAFAKYAELFIP